LHARCNAKRHELHARRNAENTTFKASRRSVHTRLDEARGELSFASNASRRNARRDLNATRDARRGECDARRGECDARRKVRGARRDARLDARRDVPRHYTDGATGAPRRYGATGVPRRYARLDCARSEEMCNANALSTFSRVPILKPVQLLCCLTEAVASDVLNHPNPAGTEHNILS
jgi:hypothetical protein